MKSHMKTLIHSTALTAGLSLGASALASPMVDLTFSRGALFPAGSVVANITYDNSGDLAPNRSFRDINVRAGMFGGQASNGVDFNETTLYRSADDVLAYCVDILEYLLMGTNTYNVNSVPMSPVTGDGSTRNFDRVLDFLGAANTVAQNTVGGPREGALNWLNPTSNWMSAAFQIGIWESLYEDTGNPLDIGGGWFSAELKGSTLQNDQASDFLDAAFTEMGSATFAGPIDPNTVKWLQIDGGQDLLVDPSEVPVPGTLLLTAAGLGLLRYRKKS